MSAPSAPQSPSEPPPVGERLQSLLSRAEAGNRTALPGLRLFLDEYPAVWREAGDLGLQARRALIALAAGENLFVAESLEQKFEEVRSAAAGRAPSALETMLAERVAMTWLSQNYYESWLTQKAGSGLAAGQVERMERAQNRAHDQHLRAVKMLATVRKLLPPPPKAKRKSRRAKV